MTPTRRGYLFEIERHAHVINFEIERGPQRK